ncbi:type IV secretory system conjugative DNA transfer family protein [Acetobacterium tundrae]|uniref:Cell division protein FtsK n=1 Tax=Acetobacterium tundrae TaxID=132932 RepID=A0ABR6WIT6_9FIRM|nr:FtsK/SpoIIIE domain-containing protein [Acetobacterium tundrae]MBC3796412.1 cell division protein FtsK [Acetobacterium tundrae]
MLQQDRQSKLFELFILEVFALISIGWLLNYQLPTNNFPIGVELIRKIGFVFYLIAGVQIVAYIVYWYVYHKLYNGFRYSFIHCKLIRNIRRELQEAGNRYSVQQYTLGEKTVVTPKIKVSLSNDMVEGKVYIQNKIKYHKIFEDVNISSALGNFVVLEQYLSKDMNTHIFEFETSEIKQLVFNTYNEFKQYCHQFEDYTLFMDGKSEVPVPLQHALIVGSTGSGKTYALFSLILQLLNFSVQPEIYFADPKNSSICVLGNKIAATRTAGTTEEIIALLGIFYNVMTERQLELKEHLNKKLDSDYKTWGMSAKVLIIDEFSSFQSVVNTFDKQTRDKVLMYLTNVVQKGRALGIYLWIAMQKSDSKIIPTSIRDNLVWKVVLGSASDMTYQTAFEEYANLPKLKFGPGQGLYSYQGLTRQPKVCSFPTLDFDILAAVD